MIRALVFALIATSLACGSSTDPDKERRIGTIAFGDPDEAHIVLPDTVPVGEDFPVSVRTHGNGCVEPGRTQVEVDGLSALIVPYDIYRTSGLNCIDIGRRFMHTASLRFSDIGTARVTVQGRGSGRSGQLGDLITVEREVVVRSP